VTIPQRSSKKKECEMLLFEGGQSFRFEEQVVNTALKGCLSVMRKIGMIGQQSTRKISSKTYMPKEVSGRGPQEVGLAISKKKVGDRIFIGDTLAIISDPFGRESVPVIAEEEGILIGSSIITNG
jgi:predicted deacylase